MIGNRPHHTPVEYAIFATLTLIIGTGGYLIMGRTLHHGYYRLIHALPHHASDTAQL